MKIRATIAAALVAPLLLVAAPAQAEEGPTLPVPLTCEETVQEWRDKAALLAYALQAAEAAVAPLQTQVATLTSNLAFERSQASLGWSTARSAEDRAERLALRNAQLAAKVAELRVKIRGMRRSR